MAEKLSKEMWKPIDNQLFGGHIVKAIKLYRELTGVDLKSAKDAVTHREQALRAAKPDKFTTPPPKKKGCMGVLLLAMVVATSIGVFLLR